VGDAQLTLALVQIESYHSHGWPPSACVPVLGR
jgi:hypothetical protein